MAWDSPGWPRDEGSPRSKRRAVSLHVKGIACDQGVDELTQCEILFLRLLHDCRGEFFVAEAERPAEGVFDELLGESARELLGFGGNDVSQFEVILECGSVVEGCGRIHGPGFSAAALGLEAVFGAPETRGIKVFQAE